MAVESMPMPRQRPGRPADALANDEVDELARDDDLPDDLFAIEMRLDVGREPAQLPQLVGAGVDRSLHAIAQLSVDLADQLVDLALQQLLIGARPVSLPYALAGQAVEDVRADVRSEREQQRGGRREREAHRLQPGGLPQSRAV